METLQSVSYLMGLVANYVMIVILFQGVFRTKKGAVILGAGFVAMVAARWIVIHRLSVPPYYASALCVVLPCIVLCFLLSRYRDGRFFFTYFFAINTYLVVRILAAMAASLFSSPVAAAWAEILVKMALLGSVGTFMWKNGGIYQGALLEDAGWNALGLESILATGLLLKLIADLDRFQNRASFYPDLLLYCTLLMIAYWVILRIIKTQRDKKQIITDALKASEEAGLAKTEFFSRMSHEIRTPLNAIIGLAELGRINLGKPEPSKAEELEYVSKTLDASHYLLSLINDILDMTRIERSEVTLVSAQMDCKQILSSICTIIETLANEKQIRFVIQQRSNCPEHVLGDEIRVKQVLINLLNNAVKFTPHGGEVRLIIERLSQTEETVTMRFVVSDTGIGISQEFLPHVFEPFAQEHHGTTSSYGGSGLGLAIARRLTRLMNGDLTVESKKGMGSVFIAVMEFSLAGESADAVAPIVEGGEIVDLSRRRILVCEDHPLNIMVIKRLLEQKGCQVMVAENGRQGLQAFNESADDYFDAVLMDIRMPEMDGLAATRAIRSLERPDAVTVPVIAMTANAYQEDVRLSLEAGMNAHLAKPIEPELLYHTLSTLMLKREE